MTEADVWTIGRLLQWAADDLRSRGNDTPRLDAEVLLSFVLGIDRIGLIVDSARPLTKDELTRYRELFKRRRAGEPVAYLRGMREFYGRPFRVDKRVLVPRPDTEVLVEVALARTRIRSLSTRALDLCTGSGCVAVSFGRERPNAHVLGTDVSADALVVARDNALRLGAFPRVWFRQSDLFDDLGLATPRFELITANPPYIPEGTYLDCQPPFESSSQASRCRAGSDGLEIVRRIVSDAPRYLAQEGILAMEIGAGQSNAVASLLTERGFVDVERTRDLAGIERVVSGKWP